MRAMAWGWGQLWWGPPRKSVVGDGGEGPDATRA